MDAQHQEPAIFMPTEAATATAPDGRRLVFFTVPQFEMMIKQVLASQPKEYTYRWAYHPGQRVHVLLFAWPNGDGAGIAIPEGAGDMILNFMLGTTDIYLTTDPVQETLQGDVSAAEVERIVYGNTVHLPGVKFKPEA